MHLTIVRMEGNVAFGWDAYNKWVNGIRIPADLADKARQNLCYVKSYDVEIDHNWWFHHVV